ncbi:hypothetical protein M407DRAFT_120816 [Tulasnella calospora MUT 4182]|uniref:Uncharacterized protein n=1 Tax=Tulasnella calospora MUT 4182 TaxID=1051891 RepID=A0A0C3Q1I5_9AGAM|nr:hypothetical protein M407DRAFT_120816 [Tulasnella calospora MUT 4182]
MSSVSQPPSELFYTYLILLQSLKAGTSNSAITASATSAFLRMTSVGLITPWISHAVEAKGAVEISLEYSEMSECDRLL